MGQNYIQIYKKNKVILDVFFFQKFFFLLLFIFKIKNILWKKINIFFFFNLISYSYLLKNLNFLFLFRTKLLHLNKILVLKKQNSFLKRKNFIINSYFNYIQSQRKRSLIKNDIIDLSLNFNKKFSINQFLLNMYFKRIDKFFLFKMVDLKKKYKKILIENRLIFNKIFFQHKKYAKKLTSIFLQLNRLRNLWTILNLESKLIFILLNSTFFINTSDIFLSCQNKNLYLNREICSNPYKNIKLGDIIELGVNKNYFLYLYSIKLFHKKNFNKLKYKLLKKLKTKVVNMNNNLYFNLLKNNFFFKKNIPNYLEVDYFSLSIFLVKPISINYIYSYSFQKFVSIFMLKQYNWKWLS